MFTSYPFICQIRFEETTQTKCSVTHFRKDFCRFSTALEGKYLTQTSDSLLIENFQPSTFNLGFKSSKRLHQKNQWRRRKVTCLGNSWRERCNMFYKRPCCTLHQLGGQVAFLSYRCQEFGKILLVRNSNSRWSKSAASLPLLKLSKQDSNHQFFNIHAGKPSLRLNLNQRQYGDLLFFVNW